MKVCRIATISFVFTNHLFSQIVDTIKRGHEVCLVSSPAPDLEGLKKTGASIHLIFIKRSISLWSDIKSLFKIIIYFKKMKFDVVHSVTQKAALLSSIAGFVTRVPIRLHTFTGQPWMYKKGLVRWVSKFCDRLIVTLNTRCYADSFSQRDYLVSQNIASGEKIYVLGMGSLAGVNLQKFSFKNLLSAQSEIRKELNIDEQYKVINFTGRVNVEKGIIELIEAFEGLSKSNKNVILLLVGPFEVDRDPIPVEVEQRIKNNSRIRILGNVSVPEKFFAISDILCIPSYREGFGNVVIEAGAMGVPAVGTCVPGLIDSIIDGKTGVLVPPRDIHQLQTALVKLLNDNELRTQMGREAKIYAKGFDSEIVNQMVLNEYDEMFSNGRALL